jgi:hypothetical protein
MSDLSFLNELDLVIRLKKVAIETDYSASANGAELLTTAITEAIVIYFFCPDIKEVTRKSQARMIIQHIRAHALMTHLTFN